MYTYYIKFYQVGVLPKFRFSLRTPFVMRERHHPLHTPHHHRPFYLLPLRFAEGIKDGVAGTR